MTKTSLLVLAATIAIIGFFASTLFGWAQQPSCGSVDRIIALITGPQNSETGMLELMAGTARLQLYSNMETGTWTLVAHQANGMACIVGSGTSIEPMGTPKGKETKS